MSLLPDAKYSGKITYAEFIESGQKGTPGIQVEVETDTGEKIGHVVWVTENTRGMVVNLMRQLRLDSKLLHTEEFWENPGTYLVGKACSIETTLEDGYNGGPAQVKVKWLNGPTGSGAPPKPGLTSSVAGMFRGFTPSSKKKQKTATAAGRPEFDNQDDDEDDD